ncbi:MAG: TonB-dependent receptor [Caulobacteraceae bacterium]|nr:TonB-dependent receptor [Caulobacteraceae bacterium]
MKRYETAILLGATSALALAANAAAETGAAKIDAQTGVATQIQEIVVTAQKRQQSINAVGIAVTALNATQMSDHRVQSAADLARLVPGFTFAETGVDAPVYSIRGAGYFDYSATAAPAVTVYTDDIPLTYPVMTQGAAFDLQRIEVLKGPQGTLFGQNSTGGLVNYVTNRPTAEPEGGFSATYGRFNAVDLEGYASGPITDTLRARLAVQSTTADAWQTSLSRNDKLGAKNKQAGKFAINWDMASNVAFAFRLNGWVDRSDPQSPQPIALTPQVPANLLPVVAIAPLASGGNDQQADWDPNQRPFRNDRFWQASGQLDWKISGTLQFTSITAYSHYNGHDYVNRDGLSSLNDQYDDTAYIGSFYQEVRLHGDNHRLDWTLGANFGQDDADEFTQDYVATSSASQNIFGKYNLATPSAVLHNSVQTAAVFASGDWTISDKLSLTTGIRYTSSEHKFVGCTIDSNDPAMEPLFAAISAAVRESLHLPYVAFTPVNNCVVLGPDFLATQPRFDLKQSNVPWRVALNYKPMPRVLLYLSATQGYKAGNSMTYVGSTSAQYKPVTQEGLLSYEAGFKVTLLDRTLQLNGAIYYYDYANKQTRAAIIDPVFGPVQALVNIPKSHAEGGELELNWLPVEGLTVNASAAFLDTRIDRWTGFSNLGVLTNFAGHPYSFAPKWQLNLDVEDRWPISDRLNGFVGGSVGYRSQSSADYYSSSLFNIDAYTLVDLRGGIETRDGKWKLSAFSENVTNTYYWTSTIKALDTTVRYTGMPRTYGVGLSIKF